MLRRMSLMKGERSCQRVSGQFNGGRIVSLMEGMVVKGGLFNGGGMVMLQEGFVTKAACLMEGKWSC